MQLVWAVFLFVVIPGLNQPSLKPVQICLKDMLPIMVKRFLELLWLSYPEQEKHKSFLWADLLPGRQSSALQCFIRGPCAHISCTCRHHCRHVLNQLNVRWTFLFVGFFWFFGWWLLLLLLLVIWLLRCLGWLLLLGVCVLFSSFFNCDMQFGTWDIGQLHRLYSSAMMTWQILKWFYIYLIWGV